MWAERSGPLYMQHHAVLVVGSATNPLLYHWAYRRRGFEAGVLNGRVANRGPAVTCLPIQDFAETQLSIHPGPLDSNYVRFSPDEAYRFPVTWQAKWSGGMDRYLRLATTSPDFKPLDRKWDELNPGERDSNWVTVDWNPQWVLDLITRGPHGDVAERGLEFGLSRITIVTRGKDGKEYIGRRYVLTADQSALGRDNITIIGCGPPTEANPRSCQHRFINRGRHFYFRHAPGEILNWQSMQRRILDLMASFEVSSTTS